MERDADDNAMAEGADSIRRARWRQKRWAIPSVLLALLIAAGIAAWFSRESIVDDIIRDQLEANNIPATYTIDHVGGQTQELSNVVLGDPDAPDFTAKRIIVQLRHRLGVPEIGSVTLVDPRLFGTYRNNELSFGSLDTLIFAPSEGPGGLPNLNVAIRDGRGLIETDMAPSGLKWSVRDWPAMAGTGRLLRLRQTFGCRAVRPVGPARMEK